MLEDPLIKYRQDLGPILILKITLDSALNSMNILGELWAYNVSKNFVSFITKCSFSEIPGILAFLLGKSW